MCIKFVDCHLSHSKDILGWLKIKMGHVTWPRPFHGFMVCRLGLVVINLSTKFEITTFARYEDTKENATSWIWDGLEWLGVIQGHRQHDHLIERTRLYIRLYYASILYRIQVLASYLSKVDNFNYTQPGLGSQLGVTQLEFRRDLWHQNKKSTGWPKKTAHYTLVHSFAVHIFAKYWPIFIILSPTYSVGNLQ